MWFRIDWKSSEQKKTKNKNIEMNIEGNWSREEESEPKYKNTKDLIQERIENFKLSHKDYYDFITFKLK